MGSVDSPGASDPQNSNTKTASVKNVDVSQHIKSTDNNPSARDALTADGERSSSPMSNDSTPHRPPLIHFLPPPRPHVRIALHGPRPKKKSIQNKAGLTGYGEASSSLNYGTTGPRRSPSPIPQKDVEAGIIIKLPSFRQFMKILAGEQAYIAAVTLFTAGAASCMTASLMPQSPPNSFSSTLFPILLGLLNTYCTLFVPNFRDRSSLPRQIGLFATCIGISNIAYIVGIGLWFRSSLGVNIALDIGNMFQGVAVSVFVYTVLEERKLLVGLESEQRDEFKAFDEKVKAQQAKTNGGNELSDDEPSLYDVGSPYEPSPYDRDQFYGSEIPLNQRWNIADQVDTH